jgi:hypothetical protein
LATHVNPHTRAEQVASELSGGLLQSVLRVHSGAGEGEGEGADGDGEGNGAGNSSVVSGQSLNVAHKAAERSVEKSVSIAQFLQIILQSNAHVSVTVQPGAVARVNATLFNAASPTLQNSPAAQTITSGVLI